MSASLDTTPADAQATPEQDASTQVLSWSAFRHAQDNEPERHDGTWADLVEVLTTVLEPPKRQDLAEAKKAVPAFSGTTFHPGTTRGNDNAESIQVLAFDFDNTREEPIPDEWHRPGRPKTRKVPIACPVHPQAVYEHLEGLGIAAVVYNTWSSGPELRKFRVAIPLDCPINPEVWPQATEWATTALGFNEWKNAGAIDLPVLRDTARLNFLPCAPDPSKVVVAEVKGKPLHIPVEKLGGVTVQDPPRAPWQEPRPKVDPNTRQEWFKTWPVNFKTLDLVGLLREKGLEIGKARPFKDGTKYRCHCPWPEEHTHALDDDCAVIIETPDDWPSFQCPHTSHKNLGLRDICEWLGAGKVAEFAEPFTDYAKLEDRSDVGNANLLINLTSGNLRYVWEWKRWLWWDGSRWIEDKSGAYALAGAKQVAQHYHKKAEDLKRQAADESLVAAERKRIIAAAAGVEKWAGQCRNKKAIDPMMAMAARDERVVVSAADLDRDPWLFGVANGTIDLRTGLLREASRDEFVTQRSHIAFDPTARAPRWRQFINEVTGKPTQANPTPRPALADYLQKMLGYCLTGSVREQKVFIAWGEGSNGKSVAFDIVQKIAGDYARTIEPKFLMAGEYLTNPESPSPVAATLAGARLAMSCESKERQKLDVALIKRHSGGGRLTARACNQNTFEFEISHKLVLQTNYKPALDHTDFALRGRLHMIPFNMKWNRPGHPKPDPTLPNGDKDLKDKLWAEAPGILTWLVEGAVRYGTDELKPPREVEDATQEYYAEQDPVARWLLGYDQCDAKQGGTMAAELIQQFQEWQRLEDDWTGGSSLGSRSFGPALVERGISKCDTKKGARYGVTRKPEAA